ncbi:MAG: Uma2 family endonuclease [Bryobacteraceae bacterium]
MSALPHPRITPEQYLEIERAAETKSEYYDGQMYAMSGGSYTHALIIGNLTAALHGALRTRGCSVVPNDLRVRVAEDGLYTYPDVVVVCAQPRFADDQKDTLLNPTLLIEALSPSTESKDRGFKFAQYRRIESLREYVLVSQEEARVECFARQASGQWLLAEFVGLDAVCHLESVDCDLPLSEIYYRVEMGPKSETA